MPTAAENRRVVRIAAIYPWRHLSQHRDDGDGLDGQSDEYYAALYWCEFTFTCVFIVEFVLKHVAYGPMWYWGNAWNVVDGVIVISGILELSMGSGADGVALLRMLRVLRIFAGLKGLRKYRAFQQVFAAVFNGVKRIASFCVVFFLFLTVFAILGMQLFGGIDGMSDKRSHFDTFGRQASRCSSSAPERTPIPWDGTS